MAESVKTRSFVKEERFWEISAADLSVEVVSGKLGTEGRAREKAFGSEAERDAFVAVQIRKVEKQGFTECDPSRIATPDVVDPFEKMCAELRRKLRRTAFVPVVADGEGKSASGSKLGGTPLDSGYDWPRCGLCARSMRFVLQLRKSEVPPVFRSVFAQDVIQLFWCDDADSLCQSEGGWEPFAKSTHVRHVRVPANPCLHERPEDVEPFPAKAVTGWEEKDDYPTSEDIAIAAPEVDSIEASIEFEERGFEPLLGDKLGGWPAWVQAAESPTCTCGKAGMKPFFQLDSDATIPIRFGRGGVAWLLSCQGCKTATLLWQN